MYAAIFHLKNIQEIGKWVCYSSSLSISAQLQVLCISIDNTNEHIRGTVDSNLFFFIESLIPNWYLHILQPTLFSLENIYSRLNHIFEYPDSKVHGANMGPIWGRQDPGGPHVSPMNFVIWVITLFTDYRANSEINMLPRMPRITKS